MKYYKTIILPYLCRISKILRKQALVQIAYQILQQTHLEKE